jgi:hypothetical protein
VNCKWVRFGYDALPLAGWRAFLLKRHIDGCPGCQGRLVDDETVRASGVTAETLFAEPPLWPVPAGRGRVRRQRSAWRLVLGLSALAAVAWVIVDVSRFAPAPSPSAARGIIGEVEEADESMVFAVLAAEIGSEPARPLIFKPQRPGMTIVWFEKIKN